MDKPIIDVPVPLFWRDAIDQALDATLQELFSTGTFSAGTFGRCADYAIVGARLLGKLTGHRYSAIAGGEFIDCGDGGYIVIFPSRTNRRRARALSDLSEYHCWIQYSHVTHEGHARCEIIDFTVRHDAEVARQKRVNFSRDLAVNYLWDWQDRLGKLPPEAYEKAGLDKRLVDRMWPDADCTRLLKEHELKHNALFEKVTGLALNRLISVIELLLKGNGGIGGTGTSE